MKLGIYILTCDDDTDILGNAVDGVAPFADTILLVDTGPAYASQHPRPNPETVRDFYRDALTCYPEQMSYLHLPWDEIAGGHAMLRNVAGQSLGAEGHDWVGFVDSDEMPTEQLAAEVRDYLQRLPRDVVTVRPHWLTLWPDESHYAPAYSQVLAHGRFYRPETVQWVNPWHEHQNYRGQRVDWGRHILHFRQLFTHRCRRQRGHGGDAWPGITEGVREVAELGVSWMSIRYPQEDTTR